MYVIHPIILEENNWKVFLILCILRLNMDPRHKYYCCNVMQNHKMRGVDTMSILLKIVKFFDLFWWRSDSFFCNIRAFYRVSFHRDTCDDTNIRNLSSAFSSLRGCLPLSVHPQASCKWEVNLILTTWPFYVVLRKWTTPESSFLRRDFLDEFD